LRRVDFPREGAVAADPSRHAAEREQGRCRGCDRAGEYVHVVDEAQSIRTRGRVQPVFEDQVHQEDGVGGAWRVLPDDLNEEAVVVRGEDAVLIRARGGRGWILLGDHIVEIHLRRMADAELIFAEETVEAERRGRGERRIRRGGRDAGEGRDRGRDRHLDLQVGIRSRF